MLFATQLCQHIEEWAPFGEYVCAFALQALKTIAGPNASLQQKDAQPDKSIGCEVTCLAAADFLNAVNHLLWYILSLLCTFLQVFVTNMHGALRAAAPAVAETAQ